MKKSVCIFALILISLLSSAQTQQGYVRTRGRLGRNGSLIAGVRIDSALVTLKGGKSVLSRNGGRFTLTFSGNRFYLQNVQKKGYILTDPGVLSRQYTSSANPLVLVMENPAQQANDRLAAERQIRRTLQQQLQKKEAEIEALKISQQKKDSLIRILYQQQGDNEKLISDMAERYSKMDFEAMDDFNRRISQLILEGKLTEADSLLNTKGDINSRAQALRQHQEANTRKEQKLQKEQEELDKSKSMAVKELEDLAQDCYNKHELFKLPHQNDSAAYYIELRANLDTTNVEWQNNAGSFICYYLANYPKALILYERGLRQSVLQYGVESEQVANLYNNIGEIYSAQGNYAKALEYYNQALTIQEKVFGKEHPDVATSYNNIGNVYYYQGNLSQALEYCNQALTIQEKVFGKEHPDVARSYNNIGTVYDNQGNYAKALEYYNQALTIQEKVLGKEHPVVAISYNNIGEIYSAQGNYAKALEYCNQALTIREKVFGKEHPDVARSYNNIGTVYDNQGNYTKALEYLLQAEKLYEEIKHPDLLNLYDMIISVYREMGNYTKVSEYQKKVFFYKSNNNQ